MVVATMHVTLLPVLTAPALVGTLFAAALTVYAMDSARMKSTSIVVSQSLVRASQEAFRGLLAAVDVDSQIRSRDRFVISTLLESNQSESGFGRTLVG